MADEFCLKMPDFHVTFKDLLHAVNPRHATNGFTSFPKEGVLRIFFALKNPTASAGFEPANLGTRQPNPLWSRDVFVFLISLRWIIFAVIHSVKTFHFSWSCLNLIVHLNITYFWVIQQNQSVERYSSVSSTIWVWHSSQPKGLRTKNWGQYLWPPGSEEMKGGWWELCGIESHDSRPSSNIIKSMEHTKLLLLRM